MNWNEVYNKIFKLINEEGSNYFSGERFISLVKEIDAEFPDYRVYIHERQLGGKSTVRKDYFRDIFLSFPEEQRLDLAKRIEKETHSPYSKNTQDLYFLLYNKLPETTDEDLKTPNDIRSLFENLSSNPAKESSQNMETSANPQNVFVVHGRNSNIKRAVFSFLRSIRLHPIEWAEAVAATGKASPYVGEVLDAGFLMAQAAVILFTPDDEARLREEYRGNNEPVYETELTPQARQNVIFEAGMALGMFPERTLLVEVGELRPISDISGRHVIRLNNSSQRRQEFANRLKTAGCSVNLGGTDWHTEGDFEMSSETPREKPAPTEIIEATDYQAIPPAKTRNLQVKKEFTDHERDEFEGKAFEFIAEFFENSLQELKKHNPHLDTDFRRIDANHFTAKIYINGMQATSCSISLNDSRLFNGITYSEGKTNSGVNESLSVESDGYNLFLKPMGLFGFSSDERDVHTIESAAEYYWKKLIRPLQQ